MYEKFKEAAEHIVIGGDLAEGVKKAYCIDG